MTLRLLPIFRGTKIDFPLLVSKEFKSDFLSKVYKRTMLKIKKAAVFSKKGGEGEIFAANAHLAARFLVIWNCLYRAVVLLPLTSFFSLVSFSSMRQ